MKNILKVLIPLAAAALMLTGCSVSVNFENGSSDSSGTVIASSVNGAVSTTLTINDVPDYSGEAYIAVNDNQPFFSDSDIKKGRSAFESYSNLDSLGRCGVAMASVCPQTEPTEKRGNISSIKPTGWVQNQYSFVDGKSLYNRCHLIGYQLTAENANKQNLITGTRYMNTQGMLPFENMVDDYVDETGNHVLYRVTPVFKGNNLLASGVLMEAYSIEDDGDGVCFCVYCYNVQPGVSIDYSTGENHAE